MKNLLFCASLLFLAACTHQENEDYLNKSTYHGTATAHWEHHFVDSSGWHVNTWDTTYIDDLSVSKDPGLNRITFEITPQIHRCAPSEFIFDFTQVPSNIYTKTYSAMQAQEFRVIDDSVKSTYLNGYEQLNDTMFCTLLFKGKK
jgi:hypothetical protein